MSGRRLRRRSPQWITILPRRNMKSRRRHPVPWTFGSGFPANGNGTVIGYGPGAAGRPGRIPAQSGFAAAGFGAVIIASGSTATGANQQVEGLKIEADRETDPLFYLKPFTNIGEPTA